ncbi:MAG: threonine synthase, partial [Oscillospiraceae bacterium]|nr:threonine synthase [Oscillospiraceae bacterium]
YYAKKMGLPINKLICASNTNNILTDFINEGEYNCKREFFKTISPSMDILISSNLERLIYELSGRDNEYIKDIFGKLQSDKYYKVEPQMQEIMQKEFYGGYCTEQETRTEIKRVFEKYSYVLDPHTAVGSKVYEDYKAKTGDNTKTVIAATANPYKFPQSVVYAIKGSGNNEKQEQKTPFEECEQLREISNQPIPQAIESLRTAELRFGREILPSRMKEVILQELGIM